MASESTAETPKATHGCADSDASAYSQGVSRTYAKSANATTARALVEELQEFFADKLCALSAANGGPATLERIEWLRDGGLHGGGHRYVSASNAVFNRAAINVSGVHYDELPDKRLRSADALSTIIHPQHPLAPSVHMHISWTEMRDGSGYYRIMADLNPSIEDPQATNSFAQALRIACPDHHQEAAREGARYFYIPALDRHRGVTHFYLESFHSGDFARDTEMARQIGKAAMQSYVDIFAAALAKGLAPTKEQRAAQLAYHTVYLFQVLTLDRGTTSGLLVHDQNDVGIMGSLPAQVDRDLLSSWQELMIAPQDALLADIVACLPEGSPSDVSESVRADLADAVRAHYQRHPEALALQASATIVPPTVDNHD